MISLIYIHIGKSLPNYIYDSIYQSLLVSPNTKIYVILDDSLMYSFRSIINEFNLNVYLKNEINIKMHVECIPISMLKVPDSYKNFVDSLSEETKTFRDAFWISTTARFFYIESFMELFKLHHVYHIENDIMIYENLEDIQVNKNVMYMVKDSTNRVIPSILFIPDCSHLNRLNNHIINNLRQSKTLINDMELLGSYNANHVSYFPFSFDNESNFIMDGAAIGQYLGGVDPRNIPYFNNKSSKEKDMLILNNPTIGFINETCTFKANSVDIFKKKFHLDNVKIPLELYYGRRESNNNIDLKQINNLHIHSKQLYQFSSVNNLKYNELISGDRIISLCDFVLLTNDIFNYHKNLELFIDINKVIIVKNFEQIDITTLNLYFKELNKKKIKLFIYTHILDLFIKYILPKLTKDLFYTIYLHNSDHQINQNHMNQLIKYNYVEKIYAQNISCYHKKLQLLPIGIANSMFKHGDLLTLYKIMSETYYKKKFKNLYININPNTYAYRHTILHEINKRPDDFKISSSKPYEEYLRDLSSYKFCLCVRGNGIACHREWESLYLGVIPVIINNKYTNTDAYVRYLKELNIPFYEIKEDTLDKYTDDFFNEELYKKIILNHGSSIYNIQSLKLQFYK